MRFETDLPKKYTRELWKLPALNERGRITRRSFNGIENTLFLYSNFAKRVAKETNNNPVNFKISEIYFVGSVARENRIDSDLDFMLIAPNIDEKSADQLKILISYVLFCDRPKSEAIDVFIRPQDKYPERESLKITGQIKELIKKYNIILE